MWTLTIYRRFFTESDCYKSGAKITPAGVQVHSTGANNPYLRRYVQPDDGRLGVNTNGNSHNRPGGDVCAHAYIGKLENGAVAVYQALPWDVRCWLSGSGPNGNANRKGYLGFEICEDALTNREYFAAAMEKAEMLTAYWCQEFGINPDEAVRDHRELHDLGLASNHGDITAWLRKFGENMDNFRANVKNFMACGISVLYIDSGEEKEMFQARAINPGTYLNIRKGMGTNYAAVGSIPRGAILDVLEEATGDWWRVQYNGVKGYAMARYLERLELGENAQEPGENAQQAEQATDTVTIPRLKLLEMQACLADCQSIVKQYLKASE